MSRSTLGIKKTLLGKLFDRPRPLNPQSFREAYNYLLPGDQDFCRFLNSTSAGEQVQLAKAILARLSHLHRFSPPQKLFANLLDFQIQMEAGEPRAQGDFIARDHYVHLVNLYLLGVYFFSYHPILHSRCARYLNQKKRSARKQTGSGSRPTNIYMAFASSFSHFVLYHDLGYPAELLQGERRREFSRYLRPFSRLNDLLMEDLALKSISHLVVAQAAAESEPRVTLDEMFLGHVGELYLASDSPGWDPESLLADGRDGEYRLKPNALKEIKDAWGDARHLPGLKGHRFKAMLSVFPDRDLCAVLEDQTTGQPLAIVFSKKEATQLCAFFAQSKLRPRGLRRISSSKLKSAAFLAEDPLGSHYVWHLFGRNPGDYLADCLKEVLPKSHKDFKSLVKRHRESLVGSTASLLSWGRGREAAFIALSGIREHFYPFESSPLSARPTYEDELETIRSSLATSLKDMPKLIGKYTAQEVESWAQEEGDNFVDLVLRRDLPGALQAIFKVLRTNEERIQRKVQGDLEPRITDEIDYQKSLRTVKQEVLEILAESIKGPEDLKPIDEDFSMENLPLAGMDGFEVVNNGVEGLGYPSISRILAEYRPSYGGENFIDHGIVGGFLTMAASKFYMDAVEALKLSAEDEFDPGGNLLRAALLTDAPEEISGVELELKFSFHEAIIAVLVHNLTIDTLPGDGKGFRVNSSGNPFAFICLLADGLQEWDRERQQNLAKSNLEAVVTGDRYDIKIKDERIVIYAWGGALRLEGKSPRQVLSHYLHGLDDAIQLSLSEV